MATSAESLDLDGVVFDRPPAQVGGLARLVTQPDTMYEPPLVIPDLSNRGIDQTPVTSILEATSLWWHSIREIKPDVLVLLESRGGSDIYGNTGRRNKRAWILKTLDALEEGGVLDRFTSIFFRPKGMHTIVSKGAALLSLSRQYDRVRHFDDNPLDVLGLAEYFPQIEFVVVQDLTTGLLFSHVEMRKYPNVRRVTS